MIAKSAIEHRITSDLRRSVLLSKIRQLKDEELVSCEAFWMGNDPIKEDTFASLQAENHFLLVGTSIFGAVAIGCYLSKINKVSPELVIVDNSKQVSRCWELTKEYFKNSEEIEILPFINEFLIYLEKHKYHVLSMDVYDSSTDQVFREYLVNLMTKYGFENIKAIVNGTLILRQNWGHTNTFETIQEVYKDQEIYAYSSNILHSISNQAEQLGVARSIEALKPKLSIQTDLLDGEPSTVYLIKDNSASNILETLTLIKRETIKDLSTDEFKSKSLKERLDKIKSGEEDYHSDDLTTKVNSCRIL